MGKRWVQREPHREANVVGRSVCGKFAYPSRRVAKRQARLGRERGEHMRPYRCRSCEAWHIGHVPDAVIAGEVTSDQIYGPFRTVHKG